MDAAREQRKDFVATLASKNRERYGSDEGRGMLHMLDLTFEPLGSTYSS